jgi:prolyl 4-hydroxylase
LHEAGWGADALAIIRHHANAGDAEALFALGDMYWRGISVDRNLSRARELFGAASEKGQPVAVRAWTNLLASGIGGERDWRQAVARLGEEARTDGLRAKMFGVISAMALDATGDPLHIPPAERLSEKLDIKLFRKAFTAAECEFLILLSEPTYERSLIIVDDKAIPDPIRTSDGSAIHWLIEDPATHAINRRIAALSDTSVHQGEPLYILRYRPGQQYRPHLDWLPPPNRRVKTALIYLNNDYQGGETEFPKVGLKVRGQMGDALVFTSALPNGDLDPLAEHSGLPVTAGTKYLASRWIREHRHTP